jgi:curli biogenesis system outer membrane secretion channel CsgG
MHSARLTLVLTLAWLAWLQPWAAAQSAANPTPAVVVWDFDNQSPPGLAGPGGGGDFLKRALSESLTAQLLQVPGLPVLERQRLHDLLAEQKVSASELADQDSRVRLGRVVGARRMVFGGYLLLGEAVQVHVRVVDTATSRVLFSDEASAELAQVMQQVQPMNQRLARALGGVAAAAASHSAASWQAYDQALALADAGRTEEAVQALQALLIRDKSFSPAERQLLALLDKMARR